MYNGLVSIIVPVYQVEKYIANCINSIISQTYKNYELIIVDDGSIDASIKIADELLRGKNINYKIIHQENSGQGFARNAGLLQSKGDWIIFVDSDDIIHPRAIECLCTFTDNDIDLVFSKFKDIYDDKEVNYEMLGANGLKINKHDIQRAFLLREKIILVPGTLYRKSFLIDNDLFMESLPWSEDQHFIWKVLIKCKNVMFVNDELYFYLRHSNSIMTSSKLEKIIESYPYIKNVEKLYPEDNICRRFLTARWVLGTLNSATKICSKKEWLRLYNSIDGRNSFKIMKKFPELRNRILALLGCISPSLYFSLIKGVKK